jgi:hypothetical protein
MENLPPELRPFGGTGKVQKAYNLEKGETNYVISTKIQNMNVLGFY